MPRNIQTDEAIQEVDAVDNTELPLEEKPEEKPVEELKSVTVKESTPSAPTPLKDGLLAPVDSKQLQGMAEFFLKSEALPKQFKNRAQVVMALQYARQIGFVNREMAALRQMTIINGTLSIWGELPKALAEATDELEYMHEEILNKDYKKISVENKNLKDEPWVAICRGKRKGHPESEKFFTMDQAQKAGLLDKTGSLYKIYPHRMIQMRARSLFLKDEFPDALSGIAILEYDYDSTVNDKGQLMQPAVRNVGTELEKEFLPDAAQA